MPVSPFLPETIAVKFPVGSVVRIAASRQSGQDRWFARICGLEVQRNLTRICRGLPIVVSRNCLSGRIVQLKSGILQTIHDAKIAQARAAPFDQTLFRTRATNDKPG